MNIGGKYQKQVENQGMFANFVICWSIETRLERTVERCGNKQDARKETGGKGTIFKTANKLENIRNNWGGVYRFNQQNAEKQWAYTFLLSRQTYKSTSRTQDKLTTSNWKGLPSGWYGMILDSQPLPACRAAATEHEVPRLTNREVAIRDFTLCWIGEKDLRSFPFNK